MWESCVVGELLCGVVKVWGNCGVRQDNQARRQGETILTQFRGLGHVNLVRPHFSIA